MDYEKAYKAVLETATQWIKDGCTDKEKICLECVFPELRETEDERNERIRKAIVHLLEVASESYLIDATGFKKEQFLSYLEKQKESLHIQETCKENADSFTDACKDVIVAIEKYLDWLTGYPDYAPKGKYSIRDMLHCLSLLEKQKPENVSATTMIPSCWEVKQKEQRNYHKLYEDITKSEWFKKAYEGKSLGSDDEQKEQKLPITGNAFGWIDELKHDLKHPEELDEKVQEVLKKRQKPVERSLEDDHIIGFVYDLLNEIEWKDNWAMSKEECLRRLKSLRPSWKPSEEQMNALRSAVNKLAKTDVADSVRLSIMYDNLKKLT